MSVSVASGCRVFNYILLNCICTDRRMIKLNGNMYNTDSRAEKQLECLIESHRCEWPQNWACMCVRLRLAQMTNDGQLLVQREIFAWPRIGSFLFFETVTTIVVSSVCFHHYQFRLMLCVGLILKFYYTFLLPFAISFTLQFCVPFLIFVVSKQQHSHGENVPQKIFHHNLSLSLYCRFRFFLFFP